MKNWADRHSRVRDAQPTWSQLLLRGCLAGALSLAVQAPAAAGSASYVYDTLGRLARIVYVQGATTTTINYSYDAAGNRTSVVTTSS